MESKELLENGPILARRRSHRRWKRGAEGRGRRTADLMLSAMVPAVIAVVVLSCGDDAVVPPPDPVAPPPDPPAFSVSFAEDSLRVVEGEAVAVGVQYRVHGLGSPAAIRVSVREGDADAADYELSETRFEIPAGSGAEGTFELSVAARADSNFAEGEEGICWSSRCRTRSKSRWVAHSRW